MVLSLEEKSAVFLGRVSELSVDNGFRSCLRRSAGLVLKDVGTSEMSLFFSAKPPDDISKDKCFLCACLQCFYEQDELSKAVKLQDAVGMLSSEERDNFIRRVLSVLDIDWDGDGYLAGKICKLVRFCRQKGIVINCGSLLCDLVFWDNDNRSVQKKWVSAMYSI